MGGAHSQRVDAAQKYAFPADGPYEIVLVDDKTVTNNIGFDIENVLCRRIVASPVSCIGIPYLANDMPSQQLSNSAATARDLLLCNLTRTYRHLRQKLSYRNLLAHKSPSAGWLVTNQPWTTYNEMVMLRGMTHENRAIIITQSTSFKTTVSTTYLCCQIIFRTRSIMVPRFHPSRSLLNSITSHYARALCSYHVQQPPSHSSPAHTNAVYILNVFSLPTHIVLRLFMLPSQRI